MALLSKNTEKSERANGSEASLSIIAAGMRITGDVETTGTLKIDGRIDGSVTGARQLLLGRGEWRHRHEVHFGPRRCPDQWNCPDE